MPRIWRLNKTEQHRATAIAAPTCEICGCETSSYGVCYGCVAAWNELRRIDKASPKAVDHFIKTRKEG